MIIQRYISKISGPLLDRIDIHIDVPAVNYRELRSPTAPESSTEVRARVVRARERQLDRFAQGKERIYANAQMGSREIRNTVS
jgi:magnesium chelatase family protein